MSIYVDESGIPLTLAEIERKAVVGALQHTQGDMAKAARLLGVGRTTLYRKISGYRLDKIDPPPPPTRYEVRQAQAVAATKASTRVKLPPGTFGTPAADAALLEILREG